MKYLSYPVVISNYVNLCLLPSLLLDAHDVKLVVSAIRCNYMQLSCTVL